MALFTKNLMEGNLKEEKFEKRFNQLKDITVSVGEARRLAFQTDKLDDETFQKFLDRQIAKKNQK